MSLPITYETHQRRAIEPDGTIHAAKYAGDRDHFTLACAVYPMPVIETLEHARPRRRHRMRRVRRLRQHRTRHPPRPPVRVLAGQFMSSPWKSAGSVADLGSLMADWLQGRIRTWPGYCDTKPADETRHLIPTLVACNQAGYVTTQSQPGEPPTRGHDGRMWRQRAFVEGWISDSRLLDRIRGAASRAGLILIDSQSGRHHDVIVTEADGEPCARFGRMPSHRRMIAHEWPGVGRQAARELAAGTRLAIIDPEWGRDNQLWPLLTATI
jgi:hypothetical protein